MARSRTSPFLAALLASAALLWPVAGEASMERARAAQARGDLRAAQIELRNAVRQDPNSAALRAALAEASLDLGDGDTAEKEIRTAMERGFDPAAGTALLARAYLVGNRHRELLRALPAPAPGAPPAVAAEVLAGRALAHLGLDQRREAREAAGEAVRLAPAALWPNLALSVLDQLDGDRAGAEAAVDRALAAAPDSPDALMRKGTLQFERGDAEGAARSFDRVLAVQPGSQQARLRRAEVRLRGGDAAGARADAEAVLRAQPGSVPANYLTALLQVQAGDFQAADQTLQRIAAQLPSVPDGLLLLATVKRNLGQAVQAEDAARRHVARRPEDPRGAKLLAGLEMEGGRPDAAAGTLTRLVQRGAADAEANDLLGRAHMAAGRPREAVEAFARAAEQAPGEGALLARLAAARLAAGDTAGMTSAARQSLEAAPGGRGTREMLAIGALSRGDLAAAEAELARLDPAARQGEAALLVEGAVKTVRLDLPGARTALEGALRAAPDSVAARIALARVAGLEGRPEEAERLLGEALRREPGNAEAAGRLGAVALSGGPRAESARAALVAAQAAAPGEPGLAGIAAGVLIRSNDAAGAVRILEAEPLRGARVGSAELSLLLAEARAAGGGWAEAEAASRAALAADPNSAVARRQIAVLLARRGDARGAETILEEGLRARPEDATLQGAVVGLAQQTGGLDGALAAAERLAARPQAWPTAGVLRGDLLLGARRAEEAVAAYAEAYRRQPGQALALRRAATLASLGRFGEAEAALDEWLGREAEDAVALAARAQLDLRAGREAEAERRLLVVVERAPADAASLNNLAWILQSRGGAEALPRARALAERAYFLAPTAEIADTLGWIRARQGEAAAAVPLLRQAVQASAAGRPAADPGMSYRLARALRETGAREEAIRVLEPAVSGGGAFAERAEAERLLRELRGG